MTPRERAALALCECAGTDDGHECMCPANKPGRVEQAIAEAIAEYQSQLIKERDKARERAERAEAEVVTLKARLAARASWGNLEDAVNADAVAAARRGALEEAAKICDEMATDRWVAEAPARAIASEIRALARGEK